MSINNIQIAKKITRILADVLEDVDKLNSNPLKSIEIRDRILQSSVLLELLANDKQPYARELGDGLLLLKLCLADVHLSANKFQSKTKNDQPDAHADTSAVRLDNSIEDTKFSHIVGCDKAKQALRENIIYHLTLPDEVLMATFTGIRSGAGNVLLHGPPGTGKTLLAQATATEAGASLIVIRPSDILSKYHGESEKFLSKSFEIMKSQGKAILFIDEFDSIATSRISMNDNIQSRRLLSELLLQLGNMKQEDEIRKRSSSGEVKKKNAKYAVIAATNRIEDIDEAIIRRFECKVLVGAPSKLFRKLLIRRFLQGIQNDLLEKDYETLSSLTYGWSGSDIETLVREAAMIPLREIYNKLGTFMKKENIRQLRMIDFETALKAVVIKPTSEEIED